MPFNGMMLMPTELRLKTTKDGIRLFSTPVKENEQLFPSENKWTNLKTNDATDHLRAINNANIYILKQKLNCLMLPMQV